MKAIEIFTRIRCSGCGLLIEESGAYGDSYVPKTWHRLDVHGAVGDGEFTLLLCRGCFGIIMDAKGAIPPAQSQA
jgi:hypothetical protein